jgi:hypothetical protein
MANDQIATYRHVGSPWDPLFPSHPTRIHELAAKIPIFRKLRSLSSGRRTGRTKNSHLLQVKLSSFWALYRSASKMPICKLCLISSGCRTGAASKTAMFCKLRFLPSRFVQGRITNSYLPRKLSFLPSGRRTEASQKIPVFCKLRFLPSRCRTKALQECPPSFFLLDVVQKRLYRFPCSANCVFFLLGVVPKFVHLQTVLSSFWMSYRCPSKIPNSCESSFLLSGWMEERIKDSHVVQIILSSFWMSYRVGSSVRLPFGTPERVFCVRGARRNSIPKAIFVTGGDEESLDSRVWFAVILRRHPCHLWRSHRSRYLFKIQFAGRSLLSVQTQLDEDCVHEAPTDSVQNRRSSPSSETVWRKKQPKTVPT